MRFTQNRITQCRGNFPRTKPNYLLLLVPWALGLGDITDKYSDSSDLPILENILNCHVKVIKSKDILNFSELDINAHCVYKRDSLLVFLEFLSNGN